MATRSSHRAEIDRIDLSSLEPLFRPASVAIIGASSDPGKIGGIPLKLLKTSRFAGALYPVNPNAATIQELPAFASIGDIGRPVDLAIIALPAPSVLGALEACAAAGVRAVIIFSAGFAEMDASGLCQQERIGAIVRNSGPRVLGPNCIGVVNFANGLFASFHPAFVDSRTDPGCIGLVSQSGAFAGHLHRMAGERDFAFSYCITTGNEADFDVADGLAFLAEDPGTEAVMACLEGCRNGPKLIAALRLARERKKPVMAMKLGRTELGAAAAQSHTGALAGSDAVFDGVFRQFGVHRAHSIEEFLDLGHACAVAPLPMNDRVALVTVSGGVGVLMADAAAQSGLDVAELPLAAQAKIKRLVPFAAARNPIDITGQVVNDLGLLEQALAISIAEDRYGSLVSFVGATPRLPERAERLRALFSRLSADYPHTVLVAAGLTTPEFRADLQARGCLTFEEPTRAVRTVAALAAFRAHFEREAALLPDEQCAIPPLPRSGALTEYESLGFLSSAGIPVVERRLVASPAAAEAAADELGFPVVLKVASAAIPHKRDSGAVALGLSTRQAVRDAYRMMAERVASRTGRAAERFVVAPMIDEGIETVLAVSCDPVFGPVVMFGLGGIFVEAVNDVVFRAGVIDVDEARRMIREIRAVGILDGIGGRPPADIDALALALARLSMIAAAHGESIESIDINPFIVRAEGRGAVALDARVIRRED
jgi:acetate---CoA ligase (ADP-forming)